MAIVSTDIKYYRTVKTGSAGDSTAGTAVGSLGGYVSTTELTTAGLHDLIEEITGDENAASAVQYKAFAVVNRHGSLVLQSAVIWMSAEVGGGAACAIGVDPTAAFASNTATKAVEIANKTTAPAGVTFTSPTTKGTGLSIGNLNAGQARLVWVRVTAANSAALASDGMTWRVEGDTAA